MLLSTFIIKVTKGHKTRTLMSLHFSNLLVDYNQSNKQLIKTAF